MGRSTRRYAILAKIQPTAGVDSVPTGGANAMLVSNVQVNPLNSSNVDRNLLRSFFGASEQLIGVAYKEASFDVEICGSGAAGTAPAWGPLLRACGIAEALTASTRADYTPVSTALEMVSMYCYVDGVEHKLLDARGDCSITMRVGEKPMFSFRFWGKNGGTAAVANPATTLTGFQTPQVPTDAFTPNFKLGGSVSGSGAPAITGGTDRNSKGLTLQFGNALNFKALINYEEVEITDRQMSGHMDIEQTAANEVSAFTDVLNNTLTSVSIEHGTQANKKVLIHLPFVQLINPTYVDDNQSLLNGYDMRCVPSAGNDEFRLVTSY